MESRNIYLRVEELLRGAHAPALKQEHVHSGLALELRLDVLDAQHRFDASLGQMQSWCALHGHPKADIEGAVDVLKRLYADALGCIPYLTGGKNSEELVQSSREQAIAEYMKMRAAVGEAKKPVPAAEAKPKAASKHK